ncbi:hypothetical protein CHELA40_12678 [Chelatococcus asaccharovorans]|nr:hypothetical protein CHELA40_12678 [Chelatococcus asaccharovorans]
MLAHHVSRHAVPAAGAQHIGGIQGFRASVCLERHLDACRALIDRCDVDSVLDVEPLVRQMLTQDGLRAPLGQAALELVFAAYACEICARQFAQARPKDLDVLDTRASLEKRVDQATAIQDFQDGGLDDRAACFMVRREPLLDDARPDAMAHELRGGEQARRTAPDNQNGGCAGRIVLLTGTWRHGLTPRNTWNRQPFESAPACIGESRAFCERFKLISGRRQLFRRPRRNPGTRAGA